MSSDSQETQKEWETRYQQNATGWDRGDSSPALTHWLDSGELKPGTILVPGCGRGHEVIALVRAGFTVTAVDIAASPIAYLQAQLDSKQLSATLIQADLMEWEAESLFDAVYEQTCLCALNPQYWPAYTTNLARWIKPGGILCALFMQTGKGGGPPFDCHPDKMRALLGTDYWSWPNQVLVENPHPTGLHELQCLLTRTESPA